MLMRERKKIEYLIKKGFFRKLLCSYILVIILLASISITSIAKTEKTSSPPGLEDNPSDTGDSPPGLDNKKTDTKDDDGEEDDDIDDASDDEEDKAIKSAVDWLKDNYDDAVSFDDDDVEGEVKYEATEKIEIKVEKEIGNVSVGEKVIVKSEKSNQTSIAGVEFVTSTDCKNVKFTVAKLKDRPEEITEEPTVNGTIYRYLDIKLTSNGTYLHEEEFESMKFEFKVEKTWINENNIDKETVTLIRYHDGWQHLTTILLSEDDNYVYYEAKTPGLSTYTVVGTQIVEASPSIIKEKTVVPLTAWIAIIIVISMIFIAVVYKLRFVYMLEKNT